VTELRTQEFADLGDEATADRSGEDDFVADCVIESDMELLLPADYVPTGERAHSPVPRSSTASSASQT